MPSDKGSSPPTVAGHAQASRRNRSFQRSSVTILLFLLPLALLWRFYPSPMEYFQRLGPATIEQRVEKILKTTPLIDGHNDLAFLLRALYGNHIYEDNFTSKFENGGFAGHADLPRLKAGLNGGAFWSVYWPCPANGSDYSDEAYREIVQDTLLQIDVVARLRDAYPEHFSGNVNGNTALKAFQSGKFISPLGIEGLHQIGNSPGNLRLYYELGVRYATLTHNCGNRYADAALWESPLRKAPPVWGGLSEDGKRLVDEMNRIGMIVDLAHVSEDTMRHVLGAGGDGWRGSRAPVIFSHSSAYALCPHPRNVPDDVLRLVRDRRSVVMVNFAPDFVSCVDASDHRDDGLPDFYPPNSTLEHVADHIIHIGQVAGFDHVGLGSDFDGILNTPKGLEDVTKFPNLVAELLRRGVSDEDAAKVVGGNLLRVWKEIDAVAARLQRDNEPVLEDDLEPLPWLHALR